MKKTNIYLKLSQPIVGHPNHPKNSKWHIFTQGSLIHTKAIRKLNNLSAADESIKSMVTGIRGETSAGYKMSCRYSKGVMISQFLELCFYCTKLIFADLATWGRRATQHFPNVLRFDSRESCFFQGFHGICNDFDSRFNILSSQLYSSLQFFQGAPLIPKKKTLSIEISGYVEFKIFCKTM